MVTIVADRLQALIAAVLEAVGASAHEAATTARVDGHWGFGQVVSERAMALAVAKARAANVAAVTVVRQGHVGRLADYPLMAAGAGMVGMMFCANVAAFARYVKETPPAPGVSEGLYPGELEWRTEQERRARGTPIEEPTWAALRRLANARGLGDLARS